MSSVATPAPAPRRPRRRRTKLQRRQSRLAWLLLVPALAVAQDTPANFDDVSAAASAARAQGDLPRAINLYQQAVLLNPQWPDGWWYL